MSQQDSLAGRYGAPSPLRRRVLVMGTVVLAAVFLAWLGWAAISHSTPEVRSSLVTFTIEDEHAATAQVEVRIRDEGTEATCRLRAISEDHTVVGEVSFAVEHGTRQPVEQTIRTERRATSVDLVGCTTADQQRPR